MPNPQDRYWVETADGNRYGPADLATLKEWATQGRLQRDATLVSESTGERVRADALEGLFGETVMSGPPPVAPPVMAPPPPKKTSSTIVILAVLGGACVLCIPVLAAILFPVFAQARLAAKRTQSLSNVKQLALGVVLYSGDNNDRFPTDMASADAMRPYIDPYVKNPLVFTTTNPNGGEYAGDPRLNGRSYNALASPGETVLLYDSVEWPSGRNPVGYADGHAKLEPFANIARLMKTDPYGGLTKAQEEKDYE